MYTNNVLYKRWDQDCPPKNPHSLNDEFEDGRFNGSWTVFDQNGNLTFSHPKKGIQLEQLYASGTSNQVAGLYMPIPSGDFTVITKVSASWQMTGNENSAGVCLWEDATDSTGDIRILAINTKRTATDMNFIGGTYAQWDAVPATDPSHINAWTPTPNTYIRLARSGTNYDTEISFDGIGWLRVDSRSITFTPTHFGLAIDTTYTNPQLRAKFHFWRYLPYDVGRGDVSLGRIVNVYE